MTALEASLLWQRAFPDRTRPVLYLDEEVDDDGFKPLSDPQTFITDISELSKLQLYATSTNNQLALRQAQDEYLSISKQIAALKGKHPPTKNPQALDEPEEFEERKEASLYGYKHEANRPALLQNGIVGNRLAEDLTDQEKRDVRLFQNPFEQGGFVPTERQYKGMMARTTNPLNIDAWKPIDRDGKQLIPRQNKERPEYTNVYVKRNIDEETGEVIRPGSSGTDESIATPSKVENKRLTRTRFGGKKVPPTRDVSESPSISSTPGRKRAVTPVPDGRDSTPSTKRRKPNNDDPNRPRHANQYTKARELAAQAAAKAAIPGTNGTTSSTTTAPAPGLMPDWSQMSTQELLTRKWTDAELLDSLKKDHSWMSPDPQKALEWRDKIANGINPVRSWSMVKKWAEWRGTGADKRPRKDRGKGVEDGVGTPGAAMVDATPAAVAEAASTARIAKAGTPASVPPSEVRGLELESVGMERSRSDIGVGGVQRRPGLARAATGMGMNGTARIERSATVTPGQPRRSLRNR